MCSSHGISGGSASTSERTSSGRATASASATHPPKDDVTRCAGREVQLLDQIRQVGGVQAGGVCGVTLTGRGVGMMIAPAVRNDAVVR